MNETRVVLLGDTHSDLDAFEYAIEVVAAEHGIKTIYQLGDFGYLLRDSWLDLLEEMLVKAGVQLSFLLGNHDAYSVSDVWEEGKDLTKPFNIRPHLTYLPRGCTWEFGGMTLMALGGAASIDRAHRVEGVSWWGGEEITYADVERCLSYEGKVDILLSHDMTTAAFEEMRDMTGLRLLPIGDGCRKALQGVVEHHRPSLLCHGHYHWLWSSVVDNMRVVGLDCNGTGTDSWAILDTVTRTVTNDTAGVLSF